MDSSFGVGGKSLSSFFLALSKPSVGQEKAPARRKILSEYVGLLTKGSLTGALGDLMVA